MANLGAVGPCLPRRDRAPVVVITFGLASLGGVFGAEVRTSRFPAIQGVEDHDLAELDEVGDPASLLQFLVESVTTSDDSDVAPELLTQLTHLGQTLEEARLVTRDPAVLVEDVAQLAMEPLRTVGPPTIE